MIEIGKFTEEDIVSLANQAYEENDAGFEIVKERSALLVIDMQDEFVKPGWTPYWVPEATRQVPKIKTVIEHCRSKNIPVIYTVFLRSNKNMDRPKSGKYMPNRYNNLPIDQSKFFVEGNIWHELAPKENDIVIHKPSYGAFFDTSLGTILKNLEKDTLIISGTLSDFCCGLTARQAYERGFCVVFGSDINSTTTPAIHENELKVLRKGFARVLSHNEIINCLK